MESSVINFTTFCADVSALYYGANFITNRDLTYTASYFWERTNDHFKWIFKFVAHYCNYMENRTGRRKLRGFWVFALILKQHMINLNAMIFLHIFAYLKPPYQLIWHQISDHIMEQEMEKAILPRA